MITESTVNALAGLLYDVYCAAVGRVAFNGDKLSSWEELSKDPKKEKQANGWKKVAKFVIKIQPQPNC